MSDETTRPPLLFSVVLGASLTMNALLMVAVLMPDREEAPATNERLEAVAVEPELLAPSEQNALLPGVETATAGAVAAPSDVMPEAAPQTVVAAPVVEPPVEAATNLSLFEEAQVTIARLQTSVPHTMATAAAPYGDNVSATLNRVLMWDLDMRRDLRPGDGIEVLWTLGTSDVVVIQASRYESLKFGRTLTAYRFHATGDTYPSYWAEDGTEIPHRLNNSPLADYEQVTSLLRDRPTHHGMDFKVDVGTPIAASFDGVVTRTNWNFSGNGNCIEVELADGTLVKYLHLSENRVNAGDRVRAGQVIALSGNTGRSTGPHLHYQLNRGDRVLDPIDVHGTTRRTLPDSDGAAFSEVVAAANQRFAAARTVASN
jgi:murein DD-endopeptidase